MNTISACRHCVVAPRLAVIIFVTSPLLAVAQHPVGSQYISVSEQRLREIEQELEYLRSRDAERQVWEDAVIQRLPHPGVHEATWNIASQRNPGNNPPGHCAVHQPINSVNCVHPLGCQSCLCPQSAAPCVDCPHVSTLGSNFNIHLFGAVKVDMLFNGARPVSPGTPFFLTPDSFTGLDQDTFDLHARQSTLGAALTGPSIGGLQSGGLFTAMFFNDSVIQDRYGLLPLQAWGELKNDEWRLAAGLQFDVFNPGLPTVLPFSALAATGNAGNSFRGQVRLERFLHPADNVQWTIQTALSEPITTTIDPSFNISEDNGWPNVEGRIALGLGTIEGVGLTAKRPFEAGVSGLVGQIRTTPAPPGDRVVANVWGLGTDLRWRFNRVFGCAGELYTGQTLGTYNGGILQNINVDTLEGVRSSGGWMEVFVYWTPFVHSHFGYGIDDPIDRDIPVSAAALGRVRNDVIFGNVLWDINQAFRIGFEVTWRETHYKSLPDNEGAGFHTQLQWAF